MRLDIYSDPRNRSTPVLYWVHMNQFTCEWCGDDFEPYRPNQKYCCHTCRDTAALSRNRRYVQDTGLPTATVGAISELHVSNDLLRKGYSVFRSLSPACGADLVAIKDNVSLFVEVRTGYVSHTGNLNYRKTLDPMASCFAVVERNSLDIFYFDTSGSEMEV